MGLGAELAVPRVAAELSQARVVQRHELESPRPLPGHGPPDPDLTRTSHTAAKRNAGEACGYEARDDQRAQAYLNSTSSTVIERNEVDAALACVAAVGV